LGSICIPASVETLCQYCFIKWIRLITTKFKMFWSPEDRLSSSVDRWYLTSKCEHRSSIFRMCDISFVLHQMFIMIRKSLTEIRICWSGIGCHADYIRRGIRIMQFWYILQCFEYPSFGSGEGDVKRESLTRYPSPPDINEMSSLSTDVRSLHIATPATDLQQMAANIRRVIWMRSYCDSGLSSTVSAKRLIYLFSLDDDESPTASDQRFITVSEIVKICSKCSQSTCGFRVSDKCPDSRPGIAASANG
jgi:hypothetical protein